MSSTDNRIVKMQFDNAQFKKGAADTQKSLADLNKAVDASGKSKGLLDMNAQMGQIGVTASKMAIVTTTALATIANKATNVAINLAKSLTFDPIKQGFLEYESLLTKQNTIMNATGLSAKRVKRELNELNKYSDQTIYSFSNMSESITKFVNAGVPLGAAVETVKGIANAAAFAGASTEDANRAMFAFSQSISNGFLTLGDFNQIESANMATVQFKETLLEAAAAQGTLQKEGNKYVTASGKRITATQGFQYSLQEQWATTEVLNTALGKYSDQSTKLGKKASEAATEVRTFTAFMDTLKESIGSGWSEVFTSLFGNLEQATTMWTGLSTAVGNVVGSFFHFAATTLKTWRQMGGFEKTIQGFKNLLSPITALLGALGDAWREVFPDSGKGAGAALYGVSAGFEAITRPLQLVADLIRGTTPFLAFFFRVIKIGGRIVGEAVGGIADFVQSLLGLVDINPPASGGFIGFVKDLARAIGDAVKKIDDLLQKGATLSQAFGSVDIDMPSMPSMPDMPSMPSMPSVAGDAGAQTSKLAVITNGVKNLKNEILDMGKASKDTSEKGLFDMGDILDMGKKIGGVLAKAKDSIFEFVKGISGEDLMQSFNMAIFATMGYEIIRFIHTVRNAVDGIVGIGGSAGKMMEDIGTGIKSFQTQARAKLILNIAIALLLLAGALWILSKIPLLDLLKALGALGATFWALSKVTESMAQSMEKMDSKGISIKLLALGATMILFAIAISILAGAMKKLNGVDWDSVVMAGGAMFLLTKSMEKLGDIDNEGIVRTGLALVIVSAGLWVFASAVRKFSSLDMKTFAEGMAYAAIALLALRTSLNGFQSSVGGAIAMVIVVGALWLLVGVIEKFASLNFKTFGEGLAYIALSLMILAGTLYAFTSSLLGAAALVVAVGALWMMVGVIQAFAALDWDTFGKGLAMFTIVIVTLATLMGLMGLLSPFILAGALALLVFGAALFLVGSGLMLLAKAMGALILISAGVGAAVTAFATSLALGFAIFLQTLAAEAPVIKKALLDILQSMIDTVVEAVPMIIQGFKDVWKAIKKEFASPGKDKDAKASGNRMIANVGDGIEKKIPAITKKAIELTVKFLNAVKSKASDLAAAGVGVIIAVLNGIARKAGDMAGAALNVILKFADGIRKNMNKVLDAGVKMVADFLHKLADTIRNGSAAIGSGIKDVVDAMKDVGVDIVKGMINGIESYADNAIGAVENMASNMVNSVLKKFKIKSPSRVFMAIGKFLVQGLTKGVQDNASLAIRSTAAMVQGQIALSMDLISKMVQDLDQKALAGRARAMGLAAAAKRAQKEANKTKGNKDDRAANKISRSAKSADRAADKAEKKVKAQKDKEARERRWAQADALERAKIKAADAQRQITAAKASERDAEAARVQAKALEQQARAEGVTAKQRKALRKEAERLRAVAKAEAKQANQQIADAQKSAASAMEWQKKAGEEASKAFQEQYDAEAKADADAEAFEKLTSVEKAAQRRKEAEELQKKADADLAKAKQLAYTDIEAANALAELALQQAERARELANEAEQFAGEGGSGQVVSLVPTDAAAMAFNQYQDLYDAAYAAAAGAATVEFTQINNSPESLSPSEIYRQTNNLVTFAADKLAPTAA